VRWCRVGKKDCVNCHMPMVELPGAHKKFTDHRIRIARAGEYPDWGVGAGKWAAGCEGHQYMGVWWGSNP
jgi:hypothetical protein